MPDYQNPFSQIHFENDFKHIPSVERYGGDVKLQMADFVKKLCLERGYAFFDPRILTRRNHLPSRYTWQDYASKQRFIALLTEDNFPTVYRKNMIHAAEWILSEGATGKHGLRIQTIFPRLEICPYLWEFSDHSTYDFRFAQTSQKPLSPFVSCAKFVSTTYDALTSLLPVFNALKRCIQNQDERIRCMKGLNELFQPLVAKHSLAFGFTDQATVSKHNL